MNYLLFTTTQCPKCPAFKEFVQKFIKFPGKIINETDESFRSLALEFAVSSVPTLLVFEDDNQEQAVLRTSEAADVYSFMNHTA